MLVLDSSPTLENLERLLEAAQSAPSSSEALVCQIRSLVFGERLVEIAFPKMAASPAEEDCRAFLKYLRKQNSGALLDFEELLIQAGHSCWVSESHLEALLESGESWNHPVVILGYSFSRAQLPELIDILKCWIDAGTNGTVERLRPTMDKLLATQRLEDRARERRRRARPG